MTHASPTQDEERVRSDATVCLVAVSTRCCCDEIMQQPTDITLAQLATAGRGIILQCGACLNQRFAKPTKLGLPLSLPVNAAGSMLKCSACGSKQVLAYPQSDRDARKGRMR